MSETPKIQVSADEKTPWQKTAAAAEKTMAEYVCKAVRERAESNGASPWERHLGSADIAVPAPTNANVRRALSESRRRKA